MTRAGSARILIPRLVGSKFATAMLLLMVERPKGIGGICAPKKRDPPERVDEAGEISPGIGVCYKTQAVESVMNIR